MKNQRTDRANICQRKIELDE